MTRLAAAALLLAAPAFAAPEPADLILHGGAVYTLAWAAPDDEGRPALGAPHDADGWHPDAEAVAIRAGRIVLVGSSEDALSLRGAATRVVDLEGATLLPGLVDAHVHALELGRALALVDLVGVETEQEAVARVAERAGRVPAGEWIVGRGWDDGAWADRYPDMERLSAAVPRHPVLLRGLHGFAAWGNRLAFERAGITDRTPAPEGGEIVRDGSGRNTGILLNRAVVLLTDALPSPGPELLERDLLRGLEALARAGYSAVHEAGVDRPALAALERLAAERRLPIRVEAMLSARDAELVREWIARGPDVDPSDLLVVRSVKAFYDGALGSRGAWLLQDYADRPGHRGIGDADYGFDGELVAEAMRAGFQAAVHAIGDAGNRGTLDFFAGLAASGLDVAAGRHRIEHAQGAPPRRHPAFRPPRGDRLDAAAPRRRGQDLGRAAARPGACEGGLCLAQPAAGGGAAGLQLRPARVRPRLLLRFPRRRHAPRRGASTVAWLVPG